MKLTSAQGGNARIKIENDESDAKYLDNHPETVSYTSPGIAHRGSIGIKDVQEADRYLVGFIQFITEYKSYLQYKKGTVSWEVGVPISDGGGDETPEQFKTDEHAWPAGFPWYQAPLKVKRNPGKSYRDAYNFYSPRVTDGPQATLPWFYNDDISNTLTSLTRAHRFECWLVIWDKHTAGIADYLSKSVWDHGASISFDFDAETGQRVKINQCFNTSHSLDHQVDNAVIPPKALIAPNANTAVKTAARYKDRPMLAPKGTVVV